jgi:hypothetical protein
MLIGIIVSSNILINKDSNFSIDKNYAYIVLGHSSSVDFKGFPTKICFTFTFFKITPLSLFYILKEKQKKL